MDHEDALLGLEDHGDACDEAFEGLFELVQLRGGLGGFAGLPDALLQVLVGLLQTLDVLIALTQLGFYAMETVAQGLRGLRIDNGHVGANPFLKARWTGGGGRGTEAAPHLRI